MVVVRKESLHLQGGEGRGGGGRTGAVRLGKCRWYRDPFILHTVVKGQDFLKARMPHGKFQAGHFGNLVGWRMDLRGQTSGTGWGRLRRLLSGPGQEEVAADSCRGVSEWNC